MRLLEASTVVAVLTVIQMSTGKVVVGPRDLNGQHPHPDLATCLAAFKPIEEAQNRTFASSGLGDYRARIDCEKRS
jgi:hypothetical protein